jgi:DNA-binding NtrC family response regulator
MKIEPACTVLLVDDDENFRSGLRRLARMIEGDAKLTTLEAGTGAEAMGVLGRQPVDCVLIDYNMPGGTGLEWIGRILEQSPHMAIIMVTGAGSERLAVEAMKSGAMDYLVKGSITLEEFQRAILNAVEKSRMQRTIEVQQKELLDAERQRVMIESLAAACHHLGQPATVITAYLAIFKRTVHAPETALMLDECMRAADSMAEILEKLQNVSEYRTIPYLPTSVGEDSQWKTNILAI